MQLAVRRGAEVVLSAPADGPVASAGAGRVRLVEPRIPVPPGLDLPRALAVGLAVAGALDIAGAPVPAGLDPLADQLDAEAERNQPGHEPFMNPAKSLALRFAEHTPLLWGTDPLATAVAGHAAAGLARHAGVVAHAADIGRASGAAGLVRALDRAAAGADIFRDPFDDDRTPPSTSRCGWCCWPPARRTRARCRCAAPAGAGRPPTSCTRWTRCRAGRAHAALLRAAVLASRLDVAAVYLGLATRTIEPAGQEH